MAETEILDAGPLRLELSQQGDRWVQRVFLLVGNGYLPIATSWEGTDEDIWPTSPAFQNLQMARQPGGALALLVGATTVAHWSASIEADPVTATLTYDVACRVRETPVWLGSSYRFDAAPTVDGESVLWQPNGAEAACRLEMHSTEDSQTQLVITEASRVRLEVMSRAPAKFPATIRWQYRFAGHRRSTQGS